MFTGIVEHLGSVIGVERSGSISRAVIDVGALDDLDIGDSIAVNGVCLTVTEVSDGHLTVEIVPETLQRSNLSELESGHRVNVERAMLVGSRFDGHIVQGHVDGIGVVTKGVGDDADGWMTISIPEELSRYVVEKGSITVDGVSLTVAATSRHGIEVAIIPHTRQVTTLGLRETGDAVNLEVDVLAKYVERLLERE